MTSTTPENPTAVATTPKSVVLPAPLLLAMLIAAAAGAVSF